MFDLVYCPANLLFFGIPLLHYYTITFNPRLPITFCLSSGDIYLSLRISLLCLFATVSELFCYEFVKLLQFYYQSNHWVLLLFLIFHYYIIFNLSIIFCLSSRDTYLCLGISWSCSFVTVPELFCGKVFETFVILAAILLPT